MILALCIALSHMYFCIPFSSSKDPVVQSAAYFPWLSSSALSGLCVHCSQLSGHAASGGWPEGLGSEGRCMSVVPKQANKQKSPKPTNPKCCSNLCNRMMGSGSFHLWPGDAMLPSVFFVREKHWVCALHSWVTERLKCRTWKETSGKARSQPQLFQRSDWNQTTKTSFLLNVSSFVTNLKKIQAW